MRAAVLTELNKNLVIDDVNLTPLKYGQVLTKNIVSGICGAQLQEISGFKGNANYLPHLMGHEGCGIVTDVGLGVNTVKIGDKVVMHWRKGIGIESPFPEYIFKNKTITSGKVTTFNEYSIVSENRLTAVPQNTPPEFCALLGCSLTTALGVITYEANVKSGESILIIGAGGVGLNLIQGAKLINACPIHVVDITDYKKTLCKTLGADYFFNLKIDKLPIQKYDVIVDTSGNPEVINLFIPFLSNIGRFILIGQPKPGSDLLLNNVNQLFEGSGKMLKATQGGMTSPTIDIPRYINLYKHKILNIDNLITHQFTLNEINTAIDLLKTNQAGKIIINL